MSDKFPDEEDTLDPPDELLELLRQADDDDGPARHDPDDDYTVVGSGRLPSGTGHSRELDEDATVIRGPRPPSPLLGRTNA